MAKDQLDRSTARERTLKRVPIKEEFVALTGDHIKAVILAQLEYWQSRVNDFDRFIGEERQRAQASGEEITAHETGGWIYKDAEELAEETMLHLAKNTMLRHISALVESGYLLRRENPHYKWDKTYQYRLNLWKIKEDLEEMGYVLEGWILPSNPEGDTEEHRSSKMEPRDSKSEHRNSEMEPRNEQNGTAIPETTPETTYREDLPPVDQFDQSQQAQDKTPDRASTDGQTDGPMDTKAQHSTETKDPPPPDRSKEGSQPTSTTDLEKALENITRDDIGEETKEVARDLLDELSQAGIELEGRDLVEVAKLAEHYRRVGRISVLRDCVLRVSKLAGEGRGEAIRSVGPYLRTCCANSEGAYDGGEEQLISELTTADEEQPSGEYGGDADISPPHPPPMPAEDRQAREAWDRLFEEFVEELGYSRGLVEVWFDGVVPASLEGSELTLAVPNEMARSKVEEKFAQRLRGLWRGELFIEVPGGEGEEG